ncbi:MAG: lysophospholipid acyltransferase family protein [Prevotella sp.]|jgi:KDO2-lipid IV(A) lauroyltransferase|nr:lysophospholipid acyltransferase family protein [Prevotella sp.]
MSKLVYYLFYALSLLPFGMLYALSDCFYVLVYHVARYRRSIVHENLSTAFPEKSSEEILKIEHEFFHWLCDYFVEAIKLLSISEKELRRHFTITNSEEIEACFQSGQNVAAILGHYCNWEWLSTVGIDLPKERKMGLIYKPLSSDIFDYLFIRLRSHLGGVPVPKNDILRYLVKYRKDGIMNFFGYISDQAPKWEDIHLWLPFLNHDTPVFTGAERIMRKMNNAVYYVEMSRPKRGQYVCTYHLITKSPSSLPEHEITRRFFAMLEATIRRNPSYYLWSHDRWKRTHEEFDRRFKVEHGRVLER